MIKNIDQIQQQLQKEEIDAWLVYQFIDMNPVYKRIVADDRNVVSRRTFLIIPKEGEPILFHSKVDGGLDELGFKSVTYISYDEFKQQLSEALKGFKKVAMEYSPMSEIPHIAKVDAGVVDLVRSMGVEVVSSGNLMQTVSSLTDEEVESHLQAAKALDEVRIALFSEIENDLKSGKSLTEYQIQQSLLKKIEQGGYQTIYEPDAVIGKNSAKSHYAPTEAESKTLEKGDLLLIDMWLKLKGDENIYADVTWMLYRGDKAPEKIQEVFAIVSRARDLAVDFLREKVSKGEPVMGWEVDKVARDYIVSKGYGQYFTHRLGHSIGTFIHGELTHLDNYENKDSRLILSNHITSVEPGIYIPDEFGVRCEIDILVKDNNVIVTTDTQTELYLLP